MKSQIFLKLPKRPRFPVLIRRIQGHSMLPVLPPGTLVWGWCWFQQLKVGSVVIFVHDNKEKIKRVSEIKVNEIYVLGDHSETSIDSRQFGWILKEQVYAKVFWPRAPKDRASS